MITDHMPAVRLPADHAGDHVAAAVPARGREETWKTAEICFCATRSPSCNAIRRAARS
jgi:hypothetical protein